LTSEMDREDLLKFIDSALRSDGTSFALDLHEAHLAEALELVSRAEAQSIWVKLDGDQKASVKPLLKGDVRDAILASLSDLGLATFALLG